jgi:hypothetical protein
LHAREVKGGKQELNPASVAASRLLRNPQVDATLYRSAGCVRTPPDKNALAERIREFVNHGRYRRRLHFDRRAEERQISDAEIFRAIDEGFPLSDAQWNEEHETWEIKLQADVDDEIFVLVLGVDLDQEFVHLITAYVREF